MKKSANRPQRLALTELDAALGNALLRVEQARDLSQKECLDVSGGWPGEVDPTTMGYVNREN
jgi:hypothetical protein